ncbi:MAG TPA: inosine/xanthosine triphosphatase [Candidatus Dojkabacteria bacterium]|nr:inosine/xanthosine triphosphatase [Candidatus Dojkabacteria bacterium]HRO64776.1 inosine/xanthosine triphosphatase [Candidatus Dojkabacteria bacterium]HRP37163.1 inosine/xanthosine triphosphatase [Candidatus Dojkabacteria bacterium]HRP51511.1 inosine/xanthosine triphosphatase [Candidatus Dojkabacteria bacterium]
MKKIVVASKNPVKINSALDGFSRMFPDEEFEIEGVSVRSHVSDQPTTNEETYKGALNRCDNASKNFAADYYVGIEGGIDRDDSGTSCFAWIIIKDKNGNYGKSRTSSFYLPPKVVDLINQGKELGEADDIVFGRTNSKQENGSVGLLTGNVIVRTGYYTEAIILALIPFKNFELYK